MIKFIKRILGIERLEILLEQDLEELSQDDRKIMERVRKLEKEFHDLIIYLGVERVEEWGEDTKYNPPQPKVISSKWVKKNETNN